MLTEPIQSLVHFPFYRQVAQRSVGRAVGYVAYIGFLFSVVATAALYVKVGPLIRESIEWAATSIPTLTFAGGKASSTLAAPTLVRHPRLSDVAIMIDTARTTPVTADEMSQRRVIAYLTQNSLYVTVNAGKLEQYDLSKRPNPAPLVVNADFYRKLGSSLTLFLYPIAWLILWVSFFVWKLLAALVYSLLGLAINAISSAGFGYEALFKIAVYAQTPVIFLQGILLFVPRQIPGFFLIGFLVVGIYTWQALRQHEPAGDSFGAAA